MADDGDAAAVAAAAIAGYVGAGEDAVEAQQAARRRYRRRQEAAGAGRGARAAGPTSAYVQGLPEDVTVDEVEAHFAKCGLVKRTPDGEPMVRLYYDSNGHQQGDALVTFLRGESVALAVQLLHDAPLRPGAGARPLQVEPARFEPSAEDAEAQAQQQEQEQEQRRKKQKKAANPEERLARAIKKKTTEQQTRALVWSFDDEEDGAFVPVVVLKRMFTLDELALSPTATSEIKEDVRSECARFGKIRRFKFYENNPDGVIMIRYADPYEAAACVKALNGRFFAGRQISAEIWDERSNYNVKASADDEEKRREEFRRWLEEDDE